MILIYIVIAALSGSEIKVNESIPFSQMHECKAFVTKNQNSMLESAGRAYGNVKITEMGCVDYNNRKLEPVVFFKTM